MLWHRQSDVGECGGDPGPCFYSWLRSKPQPHFFCYKMQNNALLYFQSSALRFVIFYFYFHFNFYLYSVYHALFGLYLESWQGWRGWQPAIILLKLRFVSAPAEYYCFSIWPYHTLMLLQDSVLYEIILSIGSPYRWPGLNRTISTPDIDLCY